MRARLHRAFAHPRAPALALVAALVLALTTLGLGHLVDDRWHDVLLGGDPSMAPVRLPAWDLFRFFDGDHARTGWMIEQGLTPWWTDRGVVLSFFRPLSALTHWLDRAAFAGVPVLAHVQSAGWYVALVTAAVFAYRKVLGPGAALGLAAWMYAVDFTHGMPVGWIANRNALVAATFGLLALGFHAIAKTRPSATWVATACMALALAGGESGIATLAYLCVYTATLDDRPLGKRVASLGPPVLVSVAWLVAYRALGYGARHGGVYLDPLESPGLVWTHVPRNASLLVAGCMGAPGPDPYTVLPDAAKLPFVGASIAMLSLSIFALWPVLVRDARARFFLFAGALAVLPGSLMVLGSMRLLVLPSFGLLGVWAIAIAGFLEAPTSRVRALVLSWNALGHVALAPLLFVGTARSMALFDGLLARLSDATAIAPGVERLVFLNAPEPSFVAHVKLYPTGRPAPDRLLAVGNGLRAMTVQRDDERSFTVTQDGSFVGGGTDALTRLRPMRVGERVQLGGAQVEVREVDARGMPTVARFSFAVPLDDARLGFVVWDGARVSRFSFPPLGERVRLPATPLSL